MPRVRGLYGSMVLLPVSWLIIWMTFLTPTSTFNLEPESAQIFSDPTPFPLRGRDSYFGFSVALQKNAEDGSAWLVVGAPRANSSNYLPAQITEPGVIFKCSLTGRESACAELWIDRTGNTPQPIYPSYQDYKNFGWLGASLDSQPSRKENRQATATCAPRWQNQYHVSSRLMNGVCYWLNSSLSLEDPANKLLPLLDYGKQIFQVDQRNLYYYQHGQAGMSIHFPDDQTEMIIGAPGIFNWQGSIIILKDNHIPDVNTFRRPKPTILERHMFSSVMIPNPYYTDSIRDFDLAGYAVASGKFFDTNRLYYVIGAPRGANMHGKVLIFPLPFSESQRLNVLVERKGSQIGENFGASLISADVTGDGLSDLIVGSPTYSIHNEPNMGRIQVFRGTTARNILKISSHSGSRKSLAKFGTTLASPGDINNDRFEDIAVGAPWEDDGRGAVYIYLGSTFGLRKEFSQRLSPEDFASQPLKGFGMSISRGIDTDQNGYPDLAIGSFVSGHALFLKSRAVASLEGHLESSPPALALDTTEFNLIACITYKGYRVPDSVDVTAQITLDYGHHAPRASFSDTRRTVKNTTIQASAGRKNCRTFQVSSEANKVDPRRPIIVHLEHGILDIPGQRLRQPKTDNSEPKIVTLPVRILTDCEDDGDSICTTDLRVDTKFTNYRKDEYLVIGRVKRPELEITISNFQESVFLPNVSISVPDPFVLFMPTSHSCEFASKGNRSSLVCQLKNPIQMGNPDTVSVTIDPSLVTDATPSASLMVSVEAAGEGYETNARDNHRTEDILLLAEAELKLQGDSIVDKIYYSRLDEDRINLTEPIITFTHHYSVVKTGPTPLGSVELIVDIPVNLTANNSFITLYTPETNFLGQPFFCNIDGATPKVAQSGNGDSENIIDIPEIANLPPDQEGSTSSREKRQAPTFLKESSKGAGTPQDYSYDKPQVFSCDKSQVSCAKVTCQINSWPGETRSASFSIKMDVDLGVLASHIPAHSGAVVKTRAKASITSLNQDLIFHGNKTTSSILETDLVPLGLTQRIVAWWIILIVVLVGLLLLILLTLLLYKFGFFRRKKQEEMEAHRALVRSQSKNYGSAAVNGSS